MKLEAGFARPGSVQESATISASPDHLRMGIWAAATLLAVAGAAFRHGLLLPAAMASAGPFATLAVVLVGGLTADRLGALRLLARLLVPDSAPALLAVAGTLTFTALVSGVVNLDVAVVVAVAVALEVASRWRLAGGRLVVSVAICANAGSFLLPTSNITTLLVLGGRELAPWSFVRASWVAWLLVVMLSVAALSVWVTAAPRQPGLPGAVSGTALGPTHRPAAARWLGWGPLLAPALSLLDLVPMFVGAVAVRALLGGGLTLGPSLLGDLGTASLLAAGVNNLPAAAALHASGGSAAWAAVLGLAIGPDLLLTGSVATLICRRIARDRGVSLGAGQLTLVGGALLPLQLGVALLGLHLTGAV